MLRLNTEKIEETKKSNPSYINFQLLIFPIKNNA